MLDQDDLKPSGNDVKSTSEEGANPAKFKFTVDLDRQVTTRTGMALKKMISKEGSINEHQLINTVRTQLEQERMVKFQQNTIWTLAVVVIIILVGGYATGILSILMTRQQIVEDAVMTNTSGEILNIDGDATEFITGEHHLMMEDPGAIQKMELTYTLMGRAAHISTDVSEVATIECLPAEDCDHTRTFHFSTGKALQVRYNNQHAGEITESHSGIQEIQLIDNANNTAEDFTLKHIFFTMGSKATRERRRLSQCSIFMMSLCPGVGAQPATGTEDSCPTCPDCPNPPPSIILPAGGTCYLKPDQVDMVSYCAWESSADGGTPESCVSASNGTCEWR